MLKTEKNERLTRVGPGTPMGELLRRYWWPIAPADALGAEPMERRLLGEDLVLFRDKEGNLGLLEQTCPHRLASLGLGYVETNGLRCGYHGWLFDRSGQCLEQPGEPDDSSFASRVKITSYPVQELGGLIFAYLGPEPAPLLPRYDIFVWENAWRDIGYATVPCNFLQIMENSVDPHHVEWLHGRYDAVLREMAGGTAGEVLTKKHVKVSFEVFEHGILKRRVLEGQTEEDDDWKIGHPLVFPSMLRIGGGGLNFFQIRVPIDDDNTWHVWYQAYQPTPDGEVPPQNVIPSYEVPLYDENGKLLRNYVDGQDITAWVTQGKINDRSREHLGSSDLGVIMLRRLFAEQVDRVENGLEPMCVFRDESEIIELPQEREKFGGGDEFRREFLLHGQTRYSPILDDVLRLFNDHEHEAVLAVRG